MKRGLILLLVFLLSMSLVSAFQAEYEPVQSEALPGGGVSYTLHLQNNEQESHTALIKSVDLNWLLEQDEIRVEVPSGEKKDVTLTFKPLGKISPGRYGIKIIVELVGPKTRLERILSATVVDYKKVLEASFTSLPILDPKRTTLSKLKLTNKNNVLLDNVDIEIRSSQFESKQKLNLGKREEKEIEIPLTLPSDTMKGDYKLNVKATLGENQLLDKEFMYTVGEYEDVKQVIEPQGSFLIGGESITLKNEGNSQVEQLYTKEFDYFAYKFATFDPEPTRVTNSDGIYLVEWNYALQPGQSRIISYTVNYRLPTFILILLAVIAALVYIFRIKNAIVVNKRVLAMHGEQGNVHVMKVVLVLKNRGNIGINNVRVIDRVPNVIKVPAQFVSMKPNHIKAAPDGTLMVWDIHHVRRRESRVISYRIEGKMQVLGRLVFPSAIVKYKSFGRMLAARSGIVSLHEKK